MQNPWATYVAQYAAAHGLTYAVALRQAGPSYRATHPANTWTGSNAGDPVALTFQPGPRKNPYIEIQGGRRTGNGRFVYAGFKRLHELAPEPSTGMKGTYQRIVIDIFRYGSHQGGRSTRYKSSVVLFIKDKQSAARLTEFLSAHTPR